MIFDLLLKPEEKLKTEILDVVITRITSNKFDQISDAADCVLYEFLYSPTPQELRNHNVV